MLTLWDLIEPVARVLRPFARPEPVVVEPREPTAPRRPSRERRGVRPGAIALGRQRAPEQNDETAQAQYDRIAKAMLERYGVRVRKWRKSMSGMAWELRYADGSVRRLIESPRPKGPMSAAVFLHEIGHHAIGFNRFKPRCLEEYHAWAWSIAAMREHRLNITDAVLRRMHESLWYAVSKARRRGIRGVPRELLPFVERPKKGEVSASMTAWLESHAQTGAAGTVSTGAGTGAHAER
ncbi:MAG: hypothetical protein ACKVS8_14745 [Phycisphaerales bacterium]